MNRRTMAAALLIVVATGYLPLPDHRGRRPDISAQHPNRRYLALVPQHPRPL